jgi:hypothetical protein
MCSFARAGRKMTGHLFIDWHATMEDCRANEGRAGEHFDGHLRLARKDAP